jgi:hypothetical protein
MLIATHSCSGGQAISGLATASEQTGGESTCREVLTMSDLKYPPTTVISTW